MKTLEEARKHLEESAVFIPDRYADGINRASWRDAAVDGQTLYDAQMMRKDVRDRRLVKIKAMTDDDWRKPAIEKGVPVIGMRVAAASDKYETNFKPIYDAVERAVGSLKPKTADMKTNVANRLIPVVEAMKKASGKV